MRTSVKRGIELEQRLVLRERLLSRSILAPTKLILVDLVMAEMDGIELVKQLRARSELAKAKIIMVTSKDHDHWRQKANDAGVDGFITKPVDQTRFASDVEAIIQPS